MAKRKVLIHTAINSLALFLLGLNMGQKTTCFNDLLLISGTDVKGGSFYVTGSNFGYLLGTLMAGALYSRVKTKPLVIVVAMVMAAGLTILTPWCDTFVSMLFVYSIQTVSCGVYETFVNTDEVRAWDGKSDSAMQFLSFCFSLGGVFGPLIAEPFLAPKEAHISTNETASNLSPLNSSVALFLSWPSNTTNTSIPYSQPSRECDGAHNCSLSRNSSSSIDNNSNASSVTLESRVYYSFLILGIITVVIAIPFVVLGFKFRSGNKEKEKEARLKATAERLPKSVYLIIMTLACVLYFCHTIAEDSFSQYLFYYVVSVLDWSKPNGAWINSMYWGSSTGIKLVLVLALRKMDTGILLFISTLGMTISIVFFTIASVLDNTILIWISTASYAISQSSIYGGIFSWVDAALLRLDGKETSAMMVFSSIGGTLGPLTLGFLLKIYPLLSFPILIVIVCVIETITFTILLFVAKPVVTRKYGPPRHHVLQEEGSKMEVLVERPSVEPGSDKDGVL